MVIRCTKEESRGRARRHEDREKGFELSGESEIEKGSSCQKIVSQL